MDATPRRAGLRPLTFLSTEATALNGLPEAPSSPPAMVGPGINVDSSLLGNALANRLHGENVPVTSYVIGINGRGTLNIPEEEFDNLIAVMVRVYLDRVAPKLPGETSEVNPGDVA